VISPAPEESWGLFVINPDGLKMLAVVHCVKPDLSIFITSSLIDRV